MLTAEPSVVNIFAYVTFGATGAPTLVAAKSKGVKTIARNSAGLYTITLGNAQGVDIYNSLLMIKHVFDESGNSGTAPVSPSMFLVANSVASAGTLQIEFNTAGTATDPASTEAVFLQIILKNSSAY